MLQLEQLHKQIEKWLVEIGKLINLRIEQGLSVECKTCPSDLVTNVDKEVEEKFRTFIAENYPTHIVFGEEQGLDTTFNSDFVWVIDPIDGTLNFTKYQKEFAVMIALFVKGVGQLGYIYDIHENNLYYAIKGKGAFCNGKPLAIAKDSMLHLSMLTTSSSVVVNRNENYIDVLRQALSFRIISSASHSLLRVILNQDNAYVSIALNPWDCMAGFVFADELGIKYTTATGKLYQPFESNSLIFATPYVHKEILSILNQ